MFTGIIEKKGRIQSIEERGGIKHLRIAVEGFTDDLKTGSSVAVNGVCLTVVSFDRSGFEVQVVGESQKATSFGSVREGTALNLEKALSSKDRLDGHYVQGHVDGTGHLRRARRQQENTLLEIQFPHELKDYIVPKGAIAVDGISLTVQSVQDDRFQSAIIPHTYKATNLSDKEEGDLLNLEVDILGKYVIHYLKGRESNV